MWYLDWQGIGSIGYLLLVLITVEMPTTAQRSQHGQKKGVRATYLNMFFFVLFCFVVVVVVVFCCCCFCFFLGGGMSRASQVYANKLLICEEWLWDRNSTPLPLVDRELKQQPRRRLRKHQIKSVFALLKTLSPLFHLVLFIRCWRIFLELNSKGLY